MDLDHNPPVTQALTVLGLESSCDETAAAVVRLHPDGQVQVLSDRIQSQDAAHAPFGGVVPEIAARQHADIIDQIIAQTMQDSQLQFSQLDGVAATTGPGLIGGVLVGMMTGKAISLAANIPFVAVNHLEGHALSPLLAADLPFPYLLLLVSGGHTQLLSVAGLGQYHRYGSTIDDAAGEAFDKTAKIIGLGFPGGPAVEQAAKTGDETRFSLPQPLARRPGCDFSFSGLKSAVQRHWQQLDAPTAQDKSDLAASFQRTASDILCRQTAKAMQLFRQQFGATTLVVAGGVAANQIIRQALQVLADEQGFGFIAPPLRYCTDNGAMIALAGAKHLRQGQTSALNIAARPRWPLDEISASLNPASGAGKKGPKS
ncbi:N(6)-L-threonylcarbamoyladenine synthase [hydrothermal vent metagenome]|uniref:N(6)-L-threonylcarbamoyladenine synthase n=1 Tax=hydrothermal vent metagenome TaxID=652676 RepID=A0A3B0S872_9ZZZZ